MKTIHKFTIKANALILALLTFVSCNDFLAEKPSKSSSVEITTASHLDGLMAHFNDFIDEVNRAALFATDDYGVITALHDATPYIYQSYYSSYTTACWDWDHFAQASSDNLWTNTGGGTSGGEWGKIFKANTVLRYLDRVSGSDTEKARLKAEAHFVRAYSHWVLANVYCLPYTEANKNEMGLPLKRTLSFEESFERASLEETYQFIEEDLQEALKCITPLVQEGRVKPWRANTAAINGFAARYYLNRNDYSQALAHANSALNEYNTLMDYNTEMYYQNSASVVIDRGTPQEQTVTLQYPWTQRENNPSGINYNDRMTTWKEFLYTRYLRAEGGYCIPSYELLAIYDKEHDLRYKYHMISHFSYIRGANGSAGVPSYDHPGYIFYSTVAHIPSGPTTAEMYLIKAECQARLGDINPAMQTLNILRASRMEPGPWVNLSATNRDDAIKQILAERRRELPFTQRWYDIRRFDNNEDPNDDVGTITRTFYKVDLTTVYGNEPPITYTLEKNSRKYALPINNAEIMISNGVLKQNVY